MLDDRTFLSPNMAAIPLSFWISRDWLQTTYSDVFAAVAVAVALASRFVEDA